MLLIVIALLWVALLAPMAVRRLRDRGTERSIESFHAEHEVLSRQGYAVAPAHRLNEPEPVAARASRLTVVHADDTYRSLESRQSWDEWSEDYDYDRYEEPAAPVNRYAHAYSSVPRDEEYARPYVAPRRTSRSARAQRRLIFSSLVGLSVVTTAGAFLVSSSLVVDVAIVAWVALAGYVSLALYAVSQGYLDESALGVRRRSVPLATVQPLYREVPLVEDDDPYGFDESPDASWRRGSSHYALG
ncbi:MAG TPA: hypothetical protein VGS61_04305 [Acidimicrobiales bacterium]|nr:hypothetical protein [Acidimicrobiales bacterium]